MCRASPCRRRHVSLLIDSITCSRAGPFGSSHVPRNPRPWLRRFASCRICVEGVRVGCIPSFPTARCECRRILHRSVPENDVTPAVSPPGGIKIYSYVYYLFSLETAFLRVRNLSQTKETSLETAHQHAQSRCAHGSVPPARRIPVHGMGCVINILLA